MFYNERTKDYQQIITPLSSNYHLDMDASYLGDEFIGFYLQLIGTLHWCVELKRIDIHLPVALLLLNLK
jgi:hypothetical protein